MPFLDVARPSAAPHANDDPPKPFFDTIRLNCGRAMLELTRSSLHETRFDNNLASQGRRLEVRISTNHLQINGFGVFGCYCKVHVRRARLCGAR